MALSFGVSGGGTVGAAVVRLVADASSLNAGLRAAEANLRGTAARMDAIGRRTAAIGSTLTRGLTVPLVAAGAVATKMALDFNQAFVRIQTLGGDTGQSMEALKAQVLDLAEATGQDPGGLANALYIVSSAGKEAAANAIPILTQAAKGAALGMGDVETITKVLTATTNSYGSEVLSAAQAMDILSQAVTDSSAEADELAASLGPVIGIAAQVGISFQEVAAALATATVQGISTDRAATGLRFLLQNLAAPTEIATQHLKEYGITAQELQRLISREGLQGSLQTLADQFDLTSVRGQQAWKYLVGGARGAIVANTLVGKHAAEAAAQVERLGDVTGVTQEKFELWGQTITGQNAKALGALKAAAIRLGTELIPVFQRIVGVVSDVVNWFNNLSEASQENVVKFALWAAAAGPILRIGGGLITVLAKVAGAFKGVGAAAAGAAGSGGALAGLAKALGAGGAVGGLAKLAPVPLVGLGGIVTPEDVQTISLWAQRAGDAGSSAAALARNLELAQAALKVNGSELRINAAAFELAAKEGISYAEALNRVRANAANTRAAMDRMNFKKVIDGAIQSEEAMRDWGEWLKVGSGLLRSQSVRLAQTIDGLYKYGGSLKKSESDALRSAIATGNMSQAVKILDGAVKRLPERKQIKIEAETDQARSEIDSFIASQSGRTISLNVRVSPGRGGETIYTQHGYHGYVSQPTVFVAGEAGRERVDISPNSGGRGSGGGGPTYVLNFNGTVVARDGHEFGRMVVDALTREQLRRS